MISYVGYTCDGYMNRWNNEANDVQYKGNNVDDLTAYGNLL